MNLTARRRKLALLQADVARTRLIAAIAVALAILLGLAATLIVLRSISRPLDDVVAAMAGRAPMQRRRKLILRISLSQSGIACWSLMTTRRRTNSLPITCVRKILGRNRQQRPRRSEACRRAPADRNHARCAHARS